MSSLFSSGAAQQVASTPLNGGLPLDGSFAPAGAPNFAAGGKFTQAAFRPPAAATIAGGTLGMARQGGDGSGAPAPAPFTSSRL